LVFSKHFGARGMLFFTQYSGSPVSQSSIKLSNNKIIN
jgi:pyridoxine/pyridoxamine 5'-phosphate oxidase